MKPDALLDGTLRARHDGDHLARLDAWHVQETEAQRGNVVVFAGSAVVFLAGLLLARSQATVRDVAWMKAMIPHHSIAILVSERAKGSDPRVRRLADQIIESQRREIAEMEALIAALEW